MTAASNAALAHLKSIKPNDGWSVKRDNNKDNGLLRLYRRNVALTDNSFMDIHYCTQNQVVVGILTKEATTCQVLVNQKGQALVGRTFVSCKDTYDPNKKVNHHTTTTRSQPRSTNPSARTSPALSPEDNKTILQYGAIVVVASILLRALSSSIALIYFVGLPLVYVYALQTCPAASTFDAKKELKRVLRGHHLPEDHPEKPKGFFEEIATRVAASVTTELATLPGYEVSMTPIGGAVILVDLVVPTANTQHYWLGAFGKWHYVYSRNQS